MPQTTSDRPEELRIGVLLLEPSRLVGTLWQRALIEEPSFLPVMVVENPGQALERLEEFDLVVVGPSLSEELALDFVRAACIERPEVAVVITGVAHSEAAVVRAAEAGAAGMVLRQQSVEEALQAIRAAGAGEARIAAEVAPVLMARLAELRRAQPDVDTIGRRYLALSPREREVLGLVAQGLTNQQIADRLVVELGTVKNHVHRILEKLDKSSREEAAGYLRSLPLEFTEAGEPPSEQTSS